jgi:hypothetical protein
VLPEGLGKFKRKYFTKTNLYIKKTLTALQEGLM